MKTTELGHQLLTFSANADFEHPGAQAVTGRHAEACVGGVVFGGLEHVYRGSVAIRLDAFHLHVFHIAQVDGPEEGQGGRISAVFDFV